MLLSVLGPLLFMRESVARPGRKAMLTVAAALVAGGVLFTVSRGAVLGMLAMAAFYVIHFKRVRAAFFAVTFVACALAVAPEAIQERLVKGIGDQAATASIVDGNNELTSGRVNIWLNLAPEIIESPLIGQGLLSTQWSEYRKSGRYWANHPHNLYLEILMDIGIIGAVCMLIFYRWVWRLFRSLGRDERLPEDVRGFFGGSLAGFVGMLIYGASNGHYYPAPEQVFFWVSVGLAMGYSRLLPPLPATAQTRRARPR
jgi:O-antigen ligase